MRTNTPAFDAWMQAPNKRPRLVAEFLFPTPKYLTSHDDVIGLPPADTLAATRLEAPWGDHELKPLQARSLIGRLQLTAIDAGGVISTMLRDQEAAGQGLKGTLVRLWRGGPDINFADYRLEATQRVEDTVSNEFSRYRFQCQDIQRGLRRELFDVVSSRMAADMPAEGAGADTLVLYDAADFEPCDHLPSFTVQPSGSHYFFKISDSGRFEYVRADVKTGNTFTGISRGQFGTAAVDWEIPEDADEDNSIEVTQLVYLEAPAPAMLYALLTGEYPGGAGTIPSNWSLGFSTADIDADAFAAAGEDLFDDTDYSRGLILRALDVERTEGKTFLEREILRLTGLYMPPLPDGRLTLRRMPSIGRDADYHVLLDNSSWISHRGLSHDLAQIRNRFELSWAYRRFPGMEQPKYFRTLTLIDAVSESRHGEQPTEKYQFKLLNNDRHTDSTLQSRFNFLRDLKAGPPLKLELTVPPELDDIEVGDVVRVVDRHTRDYQNDDTLRRSMLVTRRRVDMANGAVTLSLFGSARRADPQADPNANVVGFELPDAAYDAIATNLTDYPGVMLTND
ncbi:MAG: hypothetical protein AAF552_16115, partial [Pseudomonadota bacterium]